jgi:phage gpG-like protein
MIGARLRIQGIDKMREKLAAAKKRGGNLTQLTEYVAARAYKECINHFEKEEGPDGKWKPLAPVTIARRRQGKGTGGNKILQDTGRLRSSILFRGLRDSAIVFTNLIYGSTHQEGYKKIPQRKFLWLADGFLKDMADKFAQFIKGDMTA